MVTFLGEMEKSRPKDVDISVDYCSCVFSSPPGEYYHCHTTVGGPAWDEGLCGLVIKIRVLALSGVAQSVGALSHELNGCGFDPCSGRMSRLWVRSPAGVPMEASN